jgi:UrcA family protein
MKSLQKGMALLAAIGLGMPMVVFAASPRQIEDISITVSYEDLNVDTDAGVKALYRRLQRAAVTVCNSRQDPTIGSRLHATDSRRCYAEALTSAVESIDNDALDEIHAG